METKARRVRSKHWKRTWLNAAVSAQDGSVDDFAANRLAYASANDRKETVNAALHLERCLELIGLLGSSIQDLVVLEAAVFTAWFRKDAVTAQKWLAQVKRLKAVPQSMRVPADVAMTCARKEFDPALRRWQEGFAFIEQLPATSVREKLRASFLEWRAEIEERQQAEVGPQTLAPEALGVGDTRSQP
ncbi:MAG TPA: hypothetical protein VFE61_22575 [Candidatus Sulfotelmatobacter sp.]|nr:hypothetical protein [Candidatus Sulfotelmatobacter sp.]